MDTREAFEQRINAPNADGCTLTTVLVRALGDLLLDALGPIAEVRSRLRARELTRAGLCGLATVRLSELLAVAQEAGHECSVIAARDDLRERIIDLALDNLESERLSPEVCLLTNALQLPNEPVHALIFSAFPHIANELYPLFVDAYVAAMEDGRAFSVVGVHERWLQGASFTQAILFDTETQGLIEADVTGVPRIGSAQVLALNLREEHASHCRIADELAGVRLTNPLAGTVKLDDKAWTAACWQAAGLPTPRCAVLHVGATSDEIRNAVHAVAAADHLILKPVDGTEGRGVTLVTSNSIDEVISQHTAIERWLLCEERGLLRYTSPVGPVRCTVRLNVCWDGKAAHAESGYAQVAATPDGIASAGRGGRVIPLTDLWSGLCSPDGVPFKPIVADWQRLIGLAEDGVRVLGETLGDDMPLLVGVDLLLDRAADGLSPVLLEANGRPAGMGHSRSITDQGPTNEPGVTMCLWRQV